MTRSDLVVKQEGSASWATSLYRLSGAFKGKEINSPGYGAHDLNEYAGWLALPRDPLVESSAQIDRGLEFELLRSEKIRRAPIQLFDQATKFRSRRFSSRRVFSTSEIARRKVTKFMCRLTLRIGISFAGAYCFALVGRFSRSEFLHNKLTKRDGWLADGLTPFGNHFTYFFMLDFCCRS